MNNLISQKIPVEILMIVIVTKTMVEIQGPKKKQKRKK